MNFFLRLVGNIQRLWTRLPLREQALLAVALPMLAVIFSAVMAFVGNEERERTEGAVRRHFAMIEQLSDVLTHLLDAETGLRGHLLAGRAEFLEPYQLAARSLPQELKNLQTLIATDPREAPREKKLARLAGIRDTVGEEMALLEHLGALHAASADNAATSNAEVSLADTLLRSKQTMDKLRGQLREMRDDEQRLLQDRLQEIRAVRRRDYLTISVALFIGLITRGIAFYFFNRRVVKRIRQLTEMRAASRPAGMGRMRLLTCQMTSVNSNAHSRRRKAAGRSVASRARR